MNTRSLRQTVLPAFFCLTALASLTYAILTAAGQSQDLRVFQMGARDWVAGTYTMGAGPIFLHPPFAVPILLPLAFISLDSAVCFWLALNLLAAVVTVYALNNLYGRQWSFLPQLSLAAFLLSWAPFRVTLRVGQMSLMITALLLGSLLARQSRRQVLSGVLLALSLCKYTLTFPFVLYFIWKREWKILGTALLTLAVLTQIFLSWLGMPWTVMVREYLRAVASQSAGVTGFRGTTEIKLLIFGLTGSESLTLFITIALVLLGLVAMFLAFKRTPRCENIHFAVLGLFALWSSYHRTYDSVLCILPAALFVDFLVKEKLRKFGWAGLGALTLLVLSIPGLLTERLHLDHMQLSTNPLGFFGMHIERLMVFATFCSLLILLWRIRRQGLNDVCRPFDGS